jgi:hypothetical protein
MSSVVFGPYEYISLFLALLVLHWGVLWFAFTRQLFTAVLAGRASPTLHWIAWWSVAVGFVVIYAALVYAARAGAIDRLWLSNVSTVILFVTSVDLAVLAVRVKRSRSRPGGADEPR